MPDLPAATGPSHIMWCETHLGVTWPGPCRRTSRSGSERCVIVRLRRSLDGDGRLLGLLAEDPCPECAGSGAITDSEGAVPCAWCGGTGWMLRMPGHGPSGS